MAAVDEDFEADGNTAKANPFAVLAALKGKKVQEESEVGKK